jgi:hypothetical protein
MALLEQIRGRTADPARLAVLDEYRLVIGRLAESGAWPLPDAPNAVRLLARRWGISLAEEATSATRAAVPPGFRLNPTEASLFAQAARCGRLTIPLDLPVSSLVEKAWAAWCKENGRPPLVCQEDPP